MSFKQTGTIISISKVTILDNGAKKLSFRIDTKEAYNNIWEFEMYKSEAYAEHTDNFVKFNKVGDSVEVEFDVRPRVWAEKDRVFTSLSHWKCVKAEAGNETQPEAPVVSSTEDDDLPF